MSNTKQHRLSNEHIVYKGRVSGWYFVPSIISIVISLILIIVDINAKDLFFLGIIWFAFSLKKLFDKLSSEFIITDKRCVLKRGIITIHVVDMPLNKCDGIVLSQGFWGRIFSFGNVTATSVGITSSFYGLNNPFEFKNKLNEQMYHYNK